MLITEMEGCRQKLRLPHRSGVPAAATSRQTSGSTWRWTSTQTPVCLCTAWGTSWPRTGSRRPDLHNPRQLWRGSYLNLQFSYENSLHLNFRNPFFNKPFDLTPLPSAHSIKHFFYSSQFFLTSIDLFSLIMIVLIFFTHCSFIGIL